MNLTRMKAWAAQLNTVQPEAFSLCGWAACAAGHAADNPKFNAQGFRRAGKNSTRPVWSSPAGLHEGFGAVSSFFGLTNKQAERLCHMDGYGGRNPKPSTVARRINSMVEQERARRAG